MSNEKSSAPPRTASDIASETFRQLATQRIAPTPEAYRKLYVQISGVPDVAPEALSLPTTEPAPSAAENLLNSFAARLQQAQGELAGFGYRFSRALKASDWDDYLLGLSQLAEKFNVAVNESIKTSNSTTANIGLLPTTAITAPLTKMSLVDDASGVDQKERLLKDLLNRTLSLALASLLKPHPDLAKEADALGGAVKTAETEVALKLVAGRLKHLCFQIELSSGDNAEHQELLLRLFSLLLNNVHELLDAGNWMRGQIEVVQRLISGPIDHRALQDVTRSLKDVIFKQGVLKSSLDESKNSVKNMMSTFIEQLAAMARTTTSYHDKIDGYSHQLADNTDANRTKHFVDAILAETVNVRAEALRTRDNIIAAQQEVQEAETRIKELEDKLLHMSELVREDQLTGSLNRRGLDDLYEREADRANRRGTSLCIAMLDLDNFKKLNDTHGHAVGDEALIHLVRVVKQTLRSIDVIARYGGEEFLIVMPETSLDEAAQAMVRVQRELTKHFFTVNEERLFITFSAGVALRGLGETQEVFVKRADKAMYLAKTAGKNRVIKAD